MAGENIRGDKDQLHPMHKEEQEQLMPLILPKPTEEIEGMKPAPSFWATGRNCPSCAGQLAHFELNTETNILRVYCKSCGKKFDHTDIEETDGVFRMIPDEMINRYMAARERQLNKRG